jgi:hypothetical protein
MRNGAQLDPIPRSGARREFRGPGAHRQFDLANCLLYEESSSGLAVTLIQTDDQGCASVRPAIRITNGVKRPEKTQPLTESLPLSYWKSTTPGPE